MFKKTLNIIKHKIAYIELPVPLPIRNTFMIGPRLGIIKKQDFEPEVSDFLFSRVNARTIFADVGAEYGYHSILMAKQLSKFGSKVYSFEPSPKNLKYLKFNLILNNLTQTAVVKSVFVSDIPNELQTFSLDNQSSNLVGGGRIISVPTLTLDSLNIDFTLVKIDAEGADLNVLRGARRLISQGCEFTVEVGERFLPLHIEDYLNEIRSLGLDLYELPLARKELSNSEIIALSRKFLHINIAALPKKLK
jgi:FkbM family methyltransferase